MFEFQMIPAITLVLSLIYRLRKSLKISILLSPTTAVSSLTLILFILPALILDAKLSPIIVCGSVILTICNIYQPRFFYQKITTIKFKQRYVPYLIINFLFSVHLALSVYFAVVIIQHHGILGSLTRNRLESLLSSVGSGNFLNSMWFLSQFFFYFKISRMFTNERKKAIIIISVYILALIYYANTRLSVVAPVLIVFCSYCYLEKIKTYLIIITTIAGLLIAPSFLVYSNAARAGIDLSDVDYELGEALLYQFNYNNRISELENHYQQNQFEYGSGWLLAYVVNFIPRSVLAEKPITSFSTRLTTQITDIDISFSNPVRTYSIFGTGYSQFGLFGVFIETMLYLTLFSRLFYSSIKSKDTTLFGFYCAVMSLLYFRGEVPAVQILFLYLVFKFGGKAWKSKAKI